MDFARGFRIENFRIFVDINAKIIKVELQEWFLVGCKKEEVISSEVKHLKDVKSAHQMQMQMVGYITTTEK
eukprot:scaffold15307_cov517-Ochromonas_danica.AAC.1